MRYGENYFFTIKSPNKKCLTALLWVVRHFVILVLQSTLLLKKGAEDIPALLLHYTADYLDAVGEPAVRHIHHRATAASLFVKRTEYNPRYPGINGSAGAHGAGLQRNVQRTSV